MPGSRAVRLKELKITIYNFFYKHPFLTFLFLMGSGLTFGAMTLNIFRLVAANWKFITTYGVMALHEGALQQALEIILTGMLSMMVYLIFKFCERILIDWMRSLTIPTRGKSVDAQS